MLNKNSLQAISQLKDISDSFIFNYPITGVKNASGTIVAFLDVEKLGSEEFEEFGIIKFKEFNDLINIAGTDANTKLDSGVIYIDGKMSFKYLTTDVSVLEENYKASLKMLEKTEQAKSAIEFRITAAELSQIKKAANILNVEDLIISGEDGKVFIKTENSSQQSSNRGILEMSGASVSTDTQVILGMSNFKKLPDGDYKIKVAVNGAACITRFDSLTIDGLVINIATKAI